jgi:hypothetical protein
MCGIGIQKCIIVNLIRMMQRMGSISPKISQQKESLIGFAIIAIYYKKLLMEIYLKLKNN